MRDAVWKILSVLDAARQRSGIYGSVRDVVVLCEKLDNKLPETAEEMKASLERNIKYKPEDLLQAIEETEDSRFLEVFYNNFPGGTRPVELDRLTGFAGLRSRVDYVAKFRPTLNALEAHHPNLIHMMGGKEESFKVIDGLWQELEDIADLFGGNPGLPRWITNGDSHLYDKALDNMKDRLREGNSGTSFKDHFEKKRVQLRDEFRKARAISDRPLTEAEKLELAKDEKGVLQAMFYQYSRTAEVPASLDDLGRYLSTVSESDLAKRNHVFTEIKHLHKQGKLKAPPKGYKPHEGDNIGHEKTIIHSHPDGKPDPVKDFEALFGELFKHPPGSNQQLANYMFHVIENEPERVIQLWGRSRDMSPADLKKLFQHPPHGPEEISKRMMRDRYLEKFRDYAERYGHKPPYYERSLYGQQRLREYYHEAVVVDTNSVAHESCPIKRGLSFSGGCKLEVDLKKPLAAQQEKVTKASKDYEKNAKADAKNEAAVEKTLAKVKHGSTILKRAAFEFVINPAKARAMLIKAGVKKSVVAKWSRSKHLLIKAKGRVVKALTQQIHGIHTKVLSDSLVNHVRGMRTSRIALEKSRRKLRHAKTALRVARKTGSKSAIAAKEKMIKHLAKATDTLANKFKIAKAATKAVGADLGRSALEAGATFAKLGLKTLGVAGIAVQVYITADAALNMWSNYNKLNAKLAKGEFDAKLWEDTNLGVPDLIFGKGGTRAIGEMLKFGAQGVKKLATECLSKGDVGLAKCTFTAGKAITKFTGKALVGMGKAGLKCLKVPHDCPGQMAHAIGKAGVATGKFIGKAAVGISKSVVGLWSRGGALWKQSMARAAAQEKKCKQLGQKRCLQWLDHIRQNKDNALKKGQQLYCHGHVKYVRCGLVSVERAWDKVAGGALDYLASYGITIHKGIKLAIQRPKLLTLLCILATS